MNRPEFRIRAVTSSDRAQVESLDEAATREASRHRGATQLLNQLGPFDRRWKTVGSERTMFVAVVGSSIVGWASVVEGDRQRPLLESVFVVPQARQLGVGAAMLREVTAHFGVSRIDALSLPGDRLTKNLYERGGLKARLIVASAL
jgi:GNAT superfamily N-acetyltransferase